MGCLSACAFSNWSQNEEHTTGRKADPRSFCIQKTLQNIAHDGNIEGELMFAGHNAFRFSQDPWYSNYGMIVTALGVVALGTIYMLWVKPYENGKAPAGDAHRLATAAMKA